MLFQPLTGGHHQTTRKNPQQITDQLIPFGKESLFLFPVFLQFQRAYIFDFIFTEHD
jgi:hypothetical protein